MDCPKTMLSAQTHICEICSALPLEKLSKEEIKSIIKEERKYEKYGRDVFKLAEIIFNICSIVSIMSKNELKELSKKDIAEEHYFSGIYDTINFFIRVFIPPQAVRECLMRLELLRTDMGKKMVEEWHQFLEEELKKRSPKTDEEFETALEEIREVWNRTPRADLGGKTPQEVFFRDTKK